MDGMDRGYGGRQVGGMGWIEGKKVGFGAGRQADVREGGRKWKGWDGMVDHF